MRLVLDSFKVDDQIKKRYNNIAKRHKKEGKHTSKSALYRQALEAFITALEEENSPE